MAEKHLQIAVTFAIDNFIAVCLRLRYPLSESYRVCHGRKRCVHQQAWFQCVSRKKKVLRHLVNELLNIYRFSGIPYYFVLFIF